MNEKIYISKCCGAKVAEYDSDPETGDTGISYSCEKCGLACEVEEVCMYCLGEGTITEANGPDDYQVRKCVCQLQ